MFFKNPGESSYYPFLNILPKPTEITSPLFMSEDEINLFNSSLMSEWIREYISRIKYTHNLLKNSELAVELLPPFLLDWRAYQWASAILDTRSIWWDSSRHLVPLLDLINCKSDNDNGIIPRIHVTDYDWNGKTADTRAGRNFDIIGEEIFENYAQPNHVYTLFHGFLLDKNPHDCLRVDYLVTEEKSSAMKENKQVLIEIMKQNGFYRPFDTFCIPTSKKVENNSMETKDEDHFKDLSRLILFMKIKNGKFGGYLKGESWRDAKDEIGELMYILTTRLERLDSSEDIHSPNARPWTIDLAKKYIKNESGNLQRLLKILNEVYNSDGTQQHLDKEEL